MKLAIELWRDLNRGGWRIRRNPTCSAYLSLESDERCGKPATVRINRWPHWSMVWCPDHAADFMVPFQ